MFLSETLWGFQPHAPAYFSLAGKVGKSTHRGGTLSMGSLPYVPHPHDDAKGGARPPLETPAGEVTCPPNGRVVCLVKYVTIGLQEAVQFAIQQKTDLKQSLLLIRLANSQVTDKLIQWLQ